MTVDEVINDLPMDYVRRMRNWAKAGANPVTYAMTSAYQGERSDGYDSHFPIMTGEAQNTHRAFGAVPNRYRQAVMLFWMREGISFRELGHYLRRNAEADGDQPARGVDHHCAERWVRKGHILHQAEIARLTAIYHATVAANREAMQLDAARHGRTGSVGVVVRL